MDGGKIWMRLKRMHLGKLEKSWAAVFQVYHSLHEILTCSDQKSALFVMWP